MCFIDSSSNAGSLHTFSLNEPTIVYFEYLKFVNNNLISWYNNFIFTGFIYIYCCTLYDFHIL